MPDGFQLPPAIAGDDAEVTPDADGVKNAAYVTGGLTIMGVLGTVAWAAKDRILNILELDQESNVSLNIS